MLPAEYKKEVATDNGVETFVNISKQDEWLFKAVAGKGARPGTIGRTKMFDELKAKLLAAVAAVGGKSSDSQGSSGAPADPMAALADISPSPKKRHIYIHVKSLDG